MAHYSRIRPWAAEPWGAFEQLQRELDSLAANQRGRAQGAEGSLGVFPAVNLYESADTYILSAELPGVAPDDIHVSLEGSTVTLQGERKIDAVTRAESSVHRRERQAGSFRRSFELPVPIDADRVDAVHKHGVLTLRLPKTPEHQPRQISVRSS